MALNLSKRFSGERVPLLTKWIYAVSGLSRDAVDTLVSIFYLLYVQYSGVLSENPMLYASQLGVIIGFIFLARLWDGINDPIIGSIIENTHWKIGKYKPWIFLGSLLSSGLLIALFLVRLSGWSFVLFFVIVYLLWEFSFTLNDIAYWSMLPSLASQPKMRNQLTSLVTLFAALGALSMVIIIPLTVAGNAANQYGLVATIVAIVFLLTQSALFLFAQERQQPTSEIRQPKKVYFFQMYQTFIKNKPLFWVVWVLFLYYTGASIINNFGLTYFYISLGYDAGGSLLPVLAIVFAFSTTVSQLLYPKLSKRWSRKQLIRFSFWMLFSGYALFFFMGNIGPLNILPIHLGTLIPVGVLIFSGQGIFYVTIMVMLSNTVEYNQWQTGQRNESVIYSLRPLTAKIAASIQSGVVFVFLLISGILTVASQISGLEKDRDQGKLSEAEVVVMANNLIDQFQSQSVWGATVFKIGMVVLPLLLFVTAYWILSHKPTIDEKQYQTILDSLTRQGQSSS
jgi:melibiose permease/lactose/raffinose/galactose permease